MAIAVEPGCGRVVLPLEFIFDGEVPPPPPRLYAGASFAREGASGGLSLARSCCSSGVERQRGLGQRVVAAWSPGR
jgi:hypothetical protein